MHPRTLLRLFTALTLIGIPVVTAAETYGAGVTLKEAAPFQRLYERPSSVEGQTVRVDGVITSVCMKDGCWLGLSGGGGSDYGNSFFVRVDPGKIVFPKNVVGHKASLQGVIQPLRSDPDPEAKEAAAEFGKENTGGTPPLWELKATGAIIE